MATLKLININKVYPNRYHAVTDFNLEIHDKEFIVFVGPSGCGKSTTLRMIAGLEDISSGELYIDNKLMNNVLPKDRGIAMVFQSYALYPHMTVYSNMAFSLRLRKFFMPKYERTQEIIDLEKECLNLKRQISSLAKKKTKTEEKTKFNEEERGRLFQELLAKEEHLESLKKPILGIDQVRIDSFEKEIQKAEKELAKLHKDEKKFASDPEKYETEKETLSQDSHILTKKEKDHLETLRKYSEFHEKLLHDIANKEQEIKHLNEEIQEYQNKQAPISEYRHMTKVEIDCKVNKAADILGLSQYLYRKPQALSGGQRQRVALGRTIVRSPKVFLMDEPLSNLDAKLRSQMRSEITKIHERVGATTIYVTHDQTEAMTMADRIVVMKDGVVQQIDTPKNCYSMPNNIFVAGFIGSPSMNFYTGTYSKGTFVFDDKNGKGPFALGLTEEQAKMLEGYEGKKIVLGARPEHLFLKGEADNHHPLKDTCKAVADVCELLGRDLLIYTDILGQKTVMKINSDNMVVPHQEIEIAFNARHLFFFDSETTENIAKKKKEEE